MNQTFQGLFGPTITKQKEGEAVAVLPVRESFMNAYGFAHGGIHFNLCNIAMAAAAGAGVVGAETTVEYFGPIYAGDEVRAVGRVSRDGNTCAFAHADLYAGERHVAAASGLFLHETQGSLSPVKRPADAAQEGPSAHILSIDDREVEPSFEGDDLVLRRLFHFDFRSAAVATAEGRLAVALQTQDAYCNERGFIDAAVYGILADDALGLASISLGYHTVTVKLAVSLFEEVRPGAVLTCQGKVESDTERFVFMSGLIWADGRVVGKGSGIFCKV
ncbi:MAG: hotdog fold thioesterase [Eggerthellaceae bacterium]|nr:hotdog fold thioesterase [Eggerthellaceae bacterium]